MNVKSVPLGAARRAATVRCMCNLASLRFDFPSLLLSRSFVDELTGNLVGHLYFFLMFKYPMDLGGRSFLTTPEIL